MIRPLIAISMLVSALAVSGCHRQDPETLMCPCASARIRPPEAEAIEPVPSRVMDGVFPPDWRLGMQWRVAVTTHLSSYRRQWTRATLATDVYRFRVASLPSEPDPEFQVEMQNDRSSWRDPIILKFRARAASFSSSTSANRHRNRDQPFIETMEYADVLAFPALPLEGRNPYLFISRTDGVQQPGKQTIEVRPDGLTITIEIDETPFPPVNEAVMEWKRGDPWPASVRVWTKDRRYCDDCDDGRQVRFFRAASELLRDP